MSAVLGSAEQGRALSLCPSRFLRSPPARPPAPSLFVEGKAGGSCSAFSPFFREAERICATGRVSVARCPPFLVGHALPRFPAFVLGAARAPGPGRAAGSREPLCACRPRRPRPLRGEAGPRRGGPRAGAARGRPGPAPAAGSQRRGGREDGGGGRGGSRGVGAGPQRAAGHGAGGARHGAAPGGSGAGAAGGGAAGRPLTPLFSPQILEEVCRKQGGSPGEYGLK